MRRYLNLPIAVAMSVGCTLLATAPAKAASFQFTNIADTSNLFSSFDARPVINNSGTVAFSGNLNTGVQGIFTSDGTTIKTIVDNSGIFSRVYSPAINDKEVVAFSAQFNDGGFVTIPNPSAPPTIIVPGNGVFTSDGTTIDPIATIPRMATDRGFGINLINPSINNNNTVAFVSQQRNASSIRTSDGVFIGPTFGSSVSQPLINNVGNIAYVDNIDPIFISDGINRTSVARGSSGGGFRIGDISFNNQGTVAYTTVAFGPNGFPFGNKLLKNDPPLTTIADTNGAFSSLGVNSINDEGIVAFIASLKTGGTGIFTGADILNDKVIAIGDPLFGSTVNQVAFSNKGLNNRGQVTFFASLANGISGIFRADPQVLQSQSVPESSNIWGAIAFAVAFTVGRRNWICLGKN